MKPLFPGQLDANLMSLLHLSYSYKIVHGNPNFLLCEGDVIHSNVTVKEIVNTPTGKRVTVSGMLKHQEENAIEVTSQFFFPGNFQDFSSTFQSNTLEKVITVNDKKLKSILTSKPWIQWR
jgi:fatty acid synthase subunit beta